jgi:hypothetical protein
MCCSTEAGEDCILKSFVTCKRHEILLGDQIKEDEMGWTCSTYGRDKNEYKILIGKPEGNNRLGRTRRRWEHNIRMDLMEIGWKGVDWIHLAQDRDQWRAVLDIALNLWVP